MVAVCRLNGKPVFNHGLISIAQAVVDEKAGVSERHGRVEKSAKRRLYPHIKDEGPADELAEHAIFHGADRVLINAVERHLGHNLAIQIADRKSDLEGKNVSVSVDHGGRRIIKKK